MIDKGDFDSLEGDWLARLDEEPGDLPYFTGVARALVGHSEDERARFLLDMLDEHLREQQQWGQRLTLLREAGGILYAEAEELHPRILDTLRRLHSDRPSLEGLMEVVGLHRAPHDTPKTWTKVDRLASLVDFDVGEVVHMEGKGAGRVAEVNLSLESFRIEFDGAPPLSVGFRAAPKMLQRLPPDHFLHRKLNEPETLRALAAEDPPELLRNVLVSYDRPLTAAEIRRDVSGLVAESRWSSWWATARAHPQVVVGTSGRQTYAWAASGAEALSSVWSTFEKAEPRKKIDLLRRDGSRDPELRERMEEELDRLGESVAAEEPGLAAEIWYALEKDGRAPAEAPWSPRTLLATGDPRPILAGIHDRSLRERAYAMLRQVREDWSQCYLDALGREGDPRTLDLLADALEKVAPDELGRFVDGTIAQAHKAPAAFTWIAERAAEDEILRQRTPLRLLIQTLAAPGHHEFKDYRGRLQALCGSGGTVPRLLGIIREEQAPQVEEAIQRAGGLESYQREDLIRALHLRFPALRGDVQTPLYALAPSIAAKRKELDEILKVEIPANRKAIEEARALGDLRENFEYKSARQRHEYLTARATQLKEQLNRARPLDPDHIDPSEVRVGTTVRLSAAGGNGRTLTVLGPWESRPEDGVISYESELGEELLGRCTGETVIVDGEELTVTEITRAQV